MPGWKNANHYLASAITPYACLIWARLPERKPPTPAGRPLPSYLVSDTSTAGTKCVRRAGSLFTRKSLVSGANLMLSLITYATIQAGRRGTTPGRGFLRSSALIVKFLGLPSSTFKGNGNIYVAHKYIAIVYILSLGLPLLPRARRCHQGVRDAKQKKKFSLFKCKQREGDLGQRWAQVVLNLALDVGVWQKNEEHSMERGNAKLEGGAGGVRIIYFGGLRGY